MTCYLFTRAACLIAVLAATGTDKAASPTATSQRAPQADVTRDDLLTGRMHPAFDHLGDMGDQLDAAIASRCTVVYATGIGAYSYSGLPPRTAMDANLARLKEYNRRAHAGGVRIMLSYLCATSIVHIDTFAANWNDYFPNRPPEFAPQRMLQQDVDGKNLPSWYGADYSPADMSNPYWRQYTKMTIKLAVDSGHDGVFFDNPTVHTGGNFSSYAMTAWAKFLEQQGVQDVKSDLSSLRALTRFHVDLWRRFRVTEAADFLREIREYARSLKPDFILTTNNSLNTWDSFYSQPQMYGYSIPQQSRNQDFVTIEDMSSQPRRQDDQYVSYGSTLRLLHAISNGRPLSICSTDGNYTAPANLIGLSIAECTAHDAAYMVWACWKPEFRNACTSGVARYHDFLSENVVLLADSRPVADLLLVWPYENWVRSTECITASLARELSSRNIQYEVVTEADLTPERLKTYHAVAYAASEGLTRPSTDQMLRDYELKGGFVVRVDRAQGHASLDRLNRVMGPTSVIAEGQPGVRGVSRRTRNGECVLHLYNLNVTRVDTYHDNVTPVESLRVSWLLPPGMPGARWVRLLTPDASGTTGWHACRITPVDGRIRLDFMIPKLSIWTVVTLP